MSIKIGDIIEYETQFNENVIPRWNLFDDNGGSSITKKTQVVKIIDVSTFETRLQDGTIWVWLDPDSGYYHSDMYRVVDHKPIKARARLVLKSDGKGSMYHALELTE